MFDVIMIIVFLKLIVCFFVFVKCLLFKICNRILNIFGCVFLILLNKIIEYGLCLIFLVNCLLLLWLIYFGGVLINWFIVCFFINLFMFIWIIVLLLLNIDLVKVLVNLVLLILVGLRKIKLLIGCLGFFNFVWVCLIVLLIELIVFFCLIIFLCNVFFRLRSFLDFVLLILVNGIFVYFVMILVIFFFDNEVDMLFCVFFYLFLVFLYCFLSFVCLLCRLVVFLNFWVCIVVFFLFLIFLIFCLIFFKLLGVVWFLSFILEFVLLIKLIVLFGKKWFEMYLLFNLIVVLIVLFEILIWWCVL